MKRLLEVVLPYYSLNDAGHDIHHAHSVANLAVMYAAEFAPEFIREAKVAGYLHDICVSRGRKDHHTNAVVELTEGPLKRWFSDYVKAHELNGWAILQACAEHRASYKGEFSTPLSEVVSSADRGRPSLDGVIQRIFQSIPGRSSQDAMAFVIKKYGGYSVAQFPSMYLKVMGAGRKIMCDQIADEVSLQRRVEELRPI